MHELTQKAVSELGINANVEYITDVAKMMEMGFMTSPVLAIDGKAAITGFVPGMDKIKNAIQRNCSPKSECCRNGKCSCGSKS
ncbi:thioredoxin family protein [Patescibacteria group bacterium]|nr:thioredoxin family protein [Patescibacteria group bacterium]MCL5798345.1 thioredoxin family protein [Patescibacteria group bacterium]